jgi:hypothetical protein
VTPDELVAFPEWIRPVVANALVPVTSADAILRVHHAHLEDRLRSGADRRTVPLTTLSAGRNLTDEEAAEDRSA